MSLIISRIMKHLKESSDLMTAEELIYHEFLHFMAETMGKVLTSIDRTLVLQKRMLGWKRVRADQRYLTFLFGSVAFTHTLMKTPEGVSVYPIHDFLGLHPYQKYTPAVELKVAELATTQPYRAVAKTLDEWTPVSLTATTVGTILKRVGKAQAQADRNQVFDMEESASLPEGKKVEFLFAEADGVYIHGTNKKRSHEIHHAILYEGWEKNGKRVSLKAPQAILTTQPINDFWEEVQVSAASIYSLEQTQICTNSDGGKGYTAEHFQTAFSQSIHPVLNQLDHFHISQALRKGCGQEKGEWIPPLRLALQKKEKESFIVHLDTYESRLDESRDREKVAQFRSYILNNWERIFDWRTVVPTLPSDARGLGAMESRNRTITFRMKKRGMHWSADGAEAMAKVMQGMLNGTLQEALRSTYRTTRSVREQRKVRQTVRLSEILKDPFRASEGAKRGKVTLEAPHSSAMGRLVKSLSAL